MIYARDFLSDQIVLRSPASPAAPLVSVILPTYQRCVSGLLERAIRSVLSQTVEDLELLVMDDGSRDGSSDLIERLRADDPRLIHVRHERNCGLPALRVNEGIELARGRYLAFQFDDDCWRPHALQALLAAAAAQTEMSVIVGRARCQGPRGEWTLPAVELSLVSLLQQNRLANNSVLVDRRVVERYGLYDCHIGMRRLCDWDLWLRYMARVPFVVIDDVVAEVHESTAGSIGLTVPWDLALFRFLHAIPRDHLLTPERWRDYALDALRFGDVTPTSELRRRLHDTHLVPYYYKYRRQLPGLEHFESTLPPATQTVLYTMRAHDVLLDLNFHHFTALANQRGRYHGYFQPLLEVGPRWAEEVDALLLVRTVEEQAQPLIDQAMASGKPVGLYLDDDLLHFHEFGPKYNYLAPGTPYHESLSSYLRQVDAAWVTTPHIREMVQPLNRRLVPHSGCVPAAWLPGQLTSRDPNRPWRIGYVGSGYRLEEFRTIWEALRRLSLEYGERLEFEFWGLSVSELPALTSPVTERPFTFSYSAYLQRLHTAGFDILLTPLAGQPRARLGKSHNKYMETAVAGALGIFSDVAPYASFPAGETCLKAANTPEAWYAALSQALQMAPAEFDRMRQSLVDHVRDEFTEAALIHQHEAAWRATEFHARTRAFRHVDGRPRVLYVLHSANLGGGEIQLWRRLRLAAQYGVQPVVVLPRVLAATPAVERLGEQLQQEGMVLEFAEYTCFTEPRSPAEFNSELERGQIRDLLERCSPALVHSTTFNASLGQVCAELGVPHVANLYAVPDNWEWPAGMPAFQHCSLVTSDSVRYAARWGELLGVEHFCAREVAPAELFELGRQRDRAVAVPQPRRWRVVVAGTVQPRKQQLEAIEAVARLRQEGWDVACDIFGATHFFPEYIEQCRQAVREHGLEAIVTFRGFVHDPVDMLCSADIALCASNYESFASTVKEAMAAGVLVVSTPAGGISELLIDGCSGILCADTSVDAIVEGLRRALTLTPEAREAIVAQARRVARSEFHPHRAANDLFTTYNRALQLSGRGQTQPVRSGPAAPRLPRPAYRSQPPQDPRSHALVGRGLSYKLVPDREHWVGLDVLVGTHMRPASGTLQLAVYAPSGERVREATVELAGTRDTSWVTLAFAPIANARGQAFTLRFALIGPQPATRISLWEANPPERVYRHLLRRLGLPLPGNQLCCRMLFAD